MPPFVVAPLPEPGDRPVLFVFEKVPSVTKLYCWACACWAILKKIMASSTTLRMNVKHRIFLKLKSKIYAKLIWVYIQNFSL